MGNFTFQNGTCGSNTRCTTLNFLFSTLRKRDRYCGRGCSACKKSPEFWLKSFRGLLHPQELTAVTISNVVKRRRISFQSYCTKLVVIFFFSSQEVRLSAKTAHFWPMKVCKLLGFVSHNERCGSVVNWESPEWPRTDHRVQWRVMFER